nr:IPT/TIG domain-containing protein [uncultured Actinoplanes sp.]
MSRMHRTVRTGLTIGVTTVLIAAGSSVPAYAAPLAMTLSSVSGPSGGGNPITATAPASTAVPNPFPIGGAKPVVQFQYNGTGATSCGTAIKPVTQIANNGASTVAGALTVDPDNVQQISGTKIAFEVPSGPYPAKVDGKDSTINTTGLVLKDGQTTSKWNVCVYDGDSPTATLLATSTYTLNVRPKITKILPDSSPASGGQAITVVGVGFTTGSTATIGGSALTNVKVAANGTSLTATTPAHAPATGLPLVVSTAGGPVTSADPDNNGEPDDEDADTPGDVPLYFTYSNGITITPNNAPAGAKVSVDVKGVGFSALAFTKGTGGTPTDSKAHVFLVRDAYDAATNRGVQECKGVLVISNVELVCTLDLGADRLSPADSKPVTGQKVAEGTYTLTVVATGSAGAKPEEAAASIVSTGSTFIVAPY